MRTADVKPGETYAVARSLQALRGDPEDYLSIRIIGPVVYDKSRCTHSHAFPAEGIGDYGNRDLRTIHHRRQGYFDKSDPARFLVNPRYLVCTTAEAEQILAEHRKARSLKQAWYTHAEEAMGQLVQRLPEMKGLFIGPSNWADGVLHLSIKLEDVPGLLRRLDE